MHNQPSLAYSLPVRVIATDLLAAFSSAPVPRRPPTHPTQHHGRPRGGLQRPPAARSLHPQELEGAERGLRGSRKGVQPGHKRIRPHCAPIRQRCKHMEGRCGRLQRCSTAGRSCRTMCLPQQLGPLRLHTVGSFSARASTSPALIHMSQNSPDNYCDHSRERPALDETCCETKGP